MKRNTLLILMGLLILLTGIFSAAAAQQTDEAALSLSGQETEAEEPAQPGRIHYDYDHLTVAGATPMTGNFFCSLWGNVTADMDVRMLLHGYNLVEWESSQGMFVPDQTVISGMIVTEDRIGNRTYTIALYNDLYYSDGSRITARDYAFSMLLTMSNEAAEIGGNIKRPVYLLGYDEYISGQVPYLAGVRILADDQFSITVSADYLPFCYELGLLDCNPYPISVIAPGMRVADNGNGIYLANADGSNSDIFTADLLRKTILDEKTGCLTHPSVTSGPYTLVSFENGVAEFALNPYYKGDAHGMKPGIGRLTYESMEGNAMIKAFAEGSVGLMHKVTNAELIQNSQTVVNANDQLTMSNYPRTGLSYISFNTERPNVSDLQVRQAIAYLIDKDRFVQDTVSGYGLRTDGYYGLGQWMYQLLSGAISYPLDDLETGSAEYEAAEEAWEDLSLDDIKRYTQDVEEADAILYEAGWSLNEGGGSFRPGVEPLRYKRADNGALVPLILTMAYPENSSAADSLGLLVDDLAAGGIMLELTAMPMDELLNQYYGMEERDYDMFFLASNFDALFDPSASFVVDENGQHVWSVTRLADEELYQYAVNMRKTEAGNLIGYCREWLNFQNRFAEVLPMIPLYSNVYFDFYPKVLQNYDISSYLTWSQAVIPAYMSDVIETAEEGSEGTDADGLIEFDD